MEQNSDIKKLVEETVLSTLDYIGRVTTLITPISDEFYQNPKTESWNQLAGLLEGIGWIFDTMVSINNLQNLDTHLSSYSTWNEYVHSVIKLNDLLPELEESIKNQDNVLIADLLNYEFYPIFEDAYEKLRLLSPSGDEDYVS